jgi:hypothetical protein
MRHIAAGLAVLLTSALQLAACSREVSHLDAEKPLAGLTMEERRQYCEDRFQYVNGRIDKGDLQKIRCSMAAGGIVAGGPDASRERAACRQVYQVCINTPAPEPQSSCASFPSEADGCMATVGEADDCAKAQADELAALASQAESACEARPRSSARGGEQGATPKMQACARVQLLCPKLFREPMLEAAPRGGP